MKTKVLVVFAVAAVALGLTSIQQNAAAFNDKNPGVTNIHLHENGNTINEGIIDNHGPFDPLHPSVGNQHFNFNCNTQRASDECKVNSH
jgi:hypothetical protein